jgi:hypothetical protein
VGDGGTSAQAPDSLDRCLAWQGSEWGEGLIFPAESRRLVVLPLAVATDGQGGEDGQDGDAP